MGAFNTGSDTVNLHRLTVKVLLTRSVNVAINTAVPLAVDALV